MSKELSDIERRALGYIKSQQRKDVRATCSSLGEFLWGVNYRNPQHFARPAGKLLKRLEQKGLVYHEFTETHCVYKTR